MMLLKIEDASQLEPGQKIQRPRFGLSGFWTVDQNIRIVVYLIREVDRDLRIVRLNPIVVQENVVPFLSFARVETAYKLIETQTNPCFPSRRPRKRDPQKLLPFE